MILQPQHLAIQFKGISTPDDFQQLKYLQDHEKDWIKAQTKEQTLRMLTQIELFAAVNLRMQKVVEEDRPIIIKLVDAMMLIGEIGHRYRAAFFELKEQLLGFNWILEPIYEEKNQGLWQGRVVLKLLRQNSWASSSWVEEDESNVANLLPFEFSAK